MMKVGSIKGLNENYQPICEIDDFISLIWHQKYYEVGNFELHTTTFIKDLRYIICNSFTDAGIVESVELDGTKIVYKGRFLKCLLERKIIHKPTIYENKTTEYIAKDLVREYAGQAIGIESGEALGNPISIQITGVNLMEYIDEILREQELSSYIHYDYLTNNKTFKVFKGTDKTVTKPPLSTNFDNIYNFKYIKDERKGKNFAYVAAEEIEGRERTIITVDQSNGSEKIEIWVDAGDIQREVYENGASKTIPEKTYLEMLKQRGIETLAEYRADDSIDFTSDDDLELGDKRIFKDSQTGLLIERRVVEIITGIEDNRVNKEYVFEL